MPESACGAAERGDSPQQHKTGTVPSFRVAFIAGEYPKPSETFLLRELRALRARGLDFVIVAMKRLPDGNGDSPQQHTMGTVPIILRPGYFSWKALAAEVRFAFTHPLRWFAILVALYRGHWRSIDGMFQVMQNVPRALAVGYELRRLGVTRVHALWASLPATLGWIIARAFDMEFSFAAHARDVFVEGRMLGEKTRLASAVVACNRSAQAKLGEIVGERLGRKIALVHHGIERETLPARAASEGFVLAAGRFERKKGFDALVKACGVLGRQECLPHRKPVRAIIVGDGPERERLASLIAREKAPVELRGWMRHDELLSLLSRAGAVAAPSVVDPSGDRDGIPNIVLEAMAIGVPVVATDVGGIAEVVTDGETGFLAESGSVESLAAKLREALSGGGNADITGRARALIDREFSLDRTVSTLEGILRSGDV